MTWSFMVNADVQVAVIGEELAGAMAAINPAYPGDMELALITAKELGLTTAALSGFRTPNPYGGADTIGVSVMGTVEPVDWVESVKENIARGPDS